jgi:integrase
MSTTQPIRDENQARELADYYLQRGALRNYVLIIMGIHTALRISDLLRLKWDDVYDFEHNCVRDKIIVTESKTGKTRIILLNRRVVHALTLYGYAAKRGGFLFKSRKGGAIGRVQAYRIIRAAAEALNFSSRVSCHSLRKTFGYLAWKLGISPVVIMEIYNHSSFAVTRRYLGITQDDENEAYIKLAEVV